MKKKKKNCIGISVFSYENKEKYPIYVSKKCCEEEHVDLLLTEEGKNTMFLSMISIDSCMIIHYITEENIFVVVVYMLSLQEILKCYIKDLKLKFKCFKINGKQTIKMPKKGEYIKFKNFERNIKSPFMIYADFEIILVPEDNKKQNPNESFANKYQEHVACSYDHKLVCVDDKFIKHFKSCLDEYAVYTFISSMIVGSKYCSDVMKKHFNKELVMTKKYNEDFENSTRCWICNSDYIDNDVKIRDHCHITGKYRGSVHRDCNIINVKLNHEIPVVFHNLKIIIIHILLCKN